MNKTWVLYILECADSTLYTGITTDLDRRLSEHNSSPRGARYTRARRPVSVVASWDLPDRGSATKAEAAFKRLTRAHKLEIVAGTQPPPWSTCAP
jgi:putative endonuclease